MIMKDWVKRIDSFMEYNGSDLLIGSGKISDEQEKLHVESEFDKFRIIQAHKYVSDFDFFY